MSGGGSDTKTQTTKETPWAPAIPFKTDILQQAKSVYDSGSGQSYYPGSTVAPFSGATQAGLNSTMATAQGGNPVTGAAINSANGILNSGGLNSTQNGALGILGSIGSGANGIATGDDYAGLLSRNQGPTSSATNLAGLADKSNVGTLSSEYLTGQEFANQKAQEALQRSLGGSGRYGGNAATAQAFATQIGGQNAQANAQELARQQGLMLTANGQIDQANQGQLQGQLGILSGQTGVESQNIANQMGAANAQAAIGQQATANQMGVLGLLPTINDARYYDSQKMLGVGSAYDTQAQQQIQALIDKYNFENSAKTSALGNYANLVNGAAGNYSTQKVTAPGGSALGGILGGAVGGATAGSAFGPWGTAIGGLGGGILGGLS